MRQCIDFNHLSLGLTTFIWSNPVIIAIFSDLICRKPVKKQLKVVLEMINKYVQRCGSLQFSLSLCTKRLSNPKKLGLAEKNALTESKRVRYLGLHSKFFT